MIPARIDSPDRIPTAWNTSGEDEIPTHTEVKDAGKIVKVTGFVSEPERGG